MGKDNKKKEEGGRKKGNGLRKAAAVAGTFIVVLGIVAVAVVAQGNRKAPLSPSGPSGPSSPSGRGAKGPALLVVDQTGSGFVSLKGDAKRRAVWPDDVSLLGKPLSQLKGVDGRSGAPAWLDSGFARASSTAVRSSDGRRTAWLGSDRRDGGATVLVQMGNEQSSYSLRLRNGRRIANVQLVGWTSPQELALVGSATDTRWMYLLDMDGSVTPFFAIPEEAWLFRVADGSVYYATAQTGEGIEAPQQPPSAIWKIGLGGKAEKIADESDGVIQAFVVGGGRVAYSLEDESLKVVRDTLASAIGSGIPIMDLGDLGILVRRKDGLHIAGASDRVLEKINVPVDASVFLISEIEFSSTSSTSS